MSKPIVVGYDPAHADPAPAEFGAAAARFTRAPLIVATVEAVHHQRHDHKTGHVDDDLGSDGAPADSLDEKLSAAGVAVERRRLEGTSAARALHEAAEDLDAAMLVVGSSKRSAVGRTVAGSTAVRLLHGAPCAVAVVPRGWEPKDRLATVGVAYVDTDEGRAALQSAYALARSAGARLKVFTVIKVRARDHLEADARQGAWQMEAKDMTGVEGDHVLAAENHLRAVVAEIGADIEVDTEAFIGHPAEEIPRLSATVDLMVVGSRGYGPRRAVLLGSVSRHLMEQAQCPAIVLPRGMRLEGLAEVAAASNVEHS